MATTKGLLTGKGYFTVLLVPFLCLTGCNQKKPPTNPNEAQRSGEQSSSSSESAESSSPVQRWRESRAVAKASQPNDPVPESVPDTSTTTATNVIDSEKALKILAGYPDRLKAIVGDAYKTEKDLRAKAESGDVAAQYELGARFWQEGKFTEAYEWYKKAADNGSVRGAHALGVMYVFGQGVAIDYAEAMKWFTTAAQQGDVDSQYSLGVRYAKGDHVQQNFTEAVKWFSMAANQGQADAQVSLGRRYANGEGVPKDVVEAYKWFTIAADQKHWAANGVRDDLEKKMTPEQIAEAVNRAKGFQPIKTPVK